MKPIITPSLYPISPLRARTKFLKAKALAIEGLWAIKQPTAFLPKPMSRPFRANGEISYDVLMELTLAPLPTIKALLKTTILALISSLPLSSPSKIQANFL